MSTYIFLRHWQQTGITEPDKKTKRQAIRIEMNRTLIRRVIIRVKPQRPIQHLQWSKLNRNHWQYPKKNHRNNKQRKQKKNIFSYPPLLSCPCSVDHVHWFSFHFNLTLDFWSNSILHIFWTMNRHHHTQTQHQSLSSKVTSQVSLGFDLCEQTKSTQASNDVLPLHPTRELSPFSSPTRSQTGSTDSWTSLNSFGSTSADVRAADKIFDQIEDLLSQLSQDPLQHRLHCRVLRWHLKQDPTYSFNAVIVVHPPTKDFWTNWTLTQTHTLWFSSFLSCAVHRPSFAWEEIHNVLFFFSCTSSALHYRYISKHHCTNKNIHKHTQRLHGRTNWSIQSWYTLNEIISIIRWYDAFYLVYTRTPTYTMISSISEARRELLPMYPRQCTSTNATYDLLQSNISCKFHFLVDWIVSSRKRTTMPMSLLFVIVIHSFFLCFIIVMMKT